MFFFDKALFAVLESITHRIQRFCGLDNFFLAKIVSVVFVVSCFDTLVQTVPVPGRSSPVSSEEQKAFLLMIKTIFVPMAFVLAIGAIAVTGHMSQIVYRDQLKGLSNRWKIDPEYIWLRFLWWCVLGYVTFNVLHNGHIEWLLEDLRRTPLAPYGGLSVLAWIYLVCCDPLRPALSLLRRKWNAWLSKVQPIGQS